MNKSQKKYKKMADQLSKAGRFGDTRILHVNEAELAGLGSLVPSGKLPINPKTGQPEAGILTSIIVGSLIGAATGGATAKQKNIPVWQGILQGAATGAAGGAVTGGLGSVLGSGSTAAVEGTKAAAETAATEAVTQAGASTASDSVIQGGASLAGNSSSILDDALASQVDTGIQSSLESAATNAPVTPVTPAAAPTTGANPLGPVPFEGPVPSKFDPILDLVNQPPATQSVLRAADTPNVDTFVRALEKGALVDPLDPVSGVENITESTIENLFTEGLTDPTADPLTQGPATFTADASVATDPSFLDSLSDAVSKESLKGYFDNPVNYLAPAIMTEALLPTEYDEEDYLAGYSGPYEKSWSTGSGVSWGANNGGMVRGGVSDPQSYESSIQRFRRLLDERRRSQPNNMNMGGLATVRRF